MSAVVLTGASAGVGREVARAFARRGDSVALLAREPGRPEVARVEAEGRGARRALAIAVDVADAAAVEDAAARIEVELGPIDVGVNNAMAAALQFVYGSGRRGAQSPLYGTEPSISGGPVP